MRHPRLCDFRQYAVLSSYLSGASRKREKWNFLYIVAFAESEGSPGRDRFRILGGKERLVRPGSRDVE
jgi:hypothetical protein